MAQKEINIANQTTVDEIKANTDINNIGDSTGTLSQKLSYIISTLLNNSGGSEEITLDDVITKLDQLLKNWTSTRAGYIDNIKSAVTANSTASKTGSLSQKDAYIISLLENSSYGLSALKSSGGAAVKSVQRGQASSSRKITINAVNINKSIVITSGDGCALDHGYGCMSQSYAYLENSTSLYINCGLKNQTGNCFTVYWQVIEFY